MNKNNDGFILDDMGNKWVPDWPFVGVVTEDSVELNLAPVPDFVVVALEMLNMRKRGIV